MFKPFLNYLPIDEPIQWLNFEFPNLIEILKFILILDRNNFRIKKAIPSPYKSSICSFLF